MKCPKCQSENPERVKFCVECGHKFEFKCPQCGHVVPPAAKFCEECGHQLNFSKRAFLNKREIPNYWTGDCFGCSRNNKPGLQLRFWLSDQGCFTKCTVPDYLCGIDGLVHGGIITLLLEEVAQWLIIARLVRFGMTRDISVCYLKPVPTNAEILVEAQVINQEGKNVLNHSTIFSSDKMLLVEGESYWLFYRPT